MIQGLYKIFDHWHLEGSVWIYSDPHFCDNELASGISGRPSAEEQVKLINSKCGKKDTLIILGDVGDVKYIKQLRAKKKILIMGNHDSGKSNYERKVYTRLFNWDLNTKEEAIELIKAEYPDCKYTVEERFFLDSWLVRADNCLFDEVYEGPVMIAEKLILSHEPVDIPWAFNIHGHVHDASRKNDNKHFNVCSDVIGYVPINFNQWMKQGYLSKIDTIHRETIDRAIERKKKRNRPIKNCSTCKKSSAILNAGGVKDRCYCHKTRTYNQNTFYCSDWEEK